MKGLTRGLVALTTAALAGLFAVVAGPAGPASAASQTFTNACRNSAVGTNWDQVNVTMTGNSPAGPVQAGSTVTLSNLTLQMSVPGAIFVAGYNLGLLQVGLNSINATVNEVIDATNATPASQSTGIPNTTNNATLATTIADPDGTPGSGDETATDANTSVTFNDMTWTAGSSGTINFAEHNDPAITGATGGGLIAVAHLAGGALNVGFHCTSGTVAGSQPGVPSFSSAPTITSTAIASPLVVNAGSDQTVAPGDIVTLHGSASGGATPYTFAWTQTSGPSVTLSDPAAASPTFTAPSVASTTALGFQLQVTDNAGTMATDSVVINDSVASPVCSDPASHCTDVQNFKVTVPVGTLVISTPYHADNPFDLGTMTLDSSGTFLHASAQFGNPALPANGVTITDTRSGGLPWTAQVSASDFTFSSNSINSCNLGFTNVAPQYISGNALQSVNTSNVPNGGSGAIAAPGATCSTGVKGGPHTFATANPGTGSVYITGDFDLYAPSSTPAGTYNATVTFTIS